MAINGKQRKIDYGSRSKPELAIKKLEKRKKYGIIGDEERTEVFEEEVQKKLPVLKEVGKNGIEDASKPNSILIESDNYHALSALNYAHKGKTGSKGIDQLSSMDKTTNSQTWFCMACCHIQKQNLRSKHISRVY